jgi:hypothetical protein
MRLSFLAFVATSAVSAESLPPILDYYPECYSKPVQSLQFSSKLDTKGKLVDLGTDPRFAEVLTQLQKAAAERNAQALSIEDLKKIYPILGQVGYEGEQSVELKITATLYSFCPDNNKLRSQSTPYNAQGQKVIKTAKLVSIASQQIVIEKPSIEPLYKEPESYLVSLQHGIAGVSPGQTKAEIKTLFGHPSVTIQLQNNSELWGYGRKIWLKFDEKLQWISTDSELLSTEGLNSIELVDGYDNSDWTVEGKVRLKSHLAELQTQLPDQFRPSGELQLTRQHNQRSLTLNYQQLKNYTTNTTETLLMDFTLADGAKIPAKVPQYPVAAVADWLKQAMQNHELGVETLKQQQVPLHQFERGLNGNWIAAGNHLLLQYQDQAHSRLSKVQVGESVFLQRDDPTEIKQLLKAAGFPLTKAEFMTRYPDASDSGYEVSVYRDTHSIIASFSSEDDKAQIEKLELTLL